MSINKTLERVQERIHKQEYYEAHQAVRTVVARYTRKRDYQEAIELLYSSALLLAQAQQTGSVVDLLKYLVTTYTTAKVPVDATSRGRISEIVWQLNSTEPALKQITQQVDGWAARNGAYSTGDPELHHVFGVQYSRGGLPYDAERQLLLGIRDSAIVLADMHVAWAREEPTQAALFVSRGVLGYLTVKNLRNVHVYLNHILPAIAELLKVTPETVDKIVVIPDQPLLTFLQLLVLACEKQEQVLYRELKQRYSPNKIPAWSEALSFIERTYFDIVTQQSLNIMDFMSNMLGKP